MLIAFDTNLDCEDRFYGFPRETSRFPFPVPECVRDYLVEVKTPKGWVEIARVEGNHDRRRSHVLGEAVAASALRVTVTATNGAKEARIYEIRVY